MTQFSLQPISVKQSFFKPGRTNKRQAEGGKLHQFLKNN